MESSELAGVVEQVVRRCQRAGLSRADAEDCVHEALLALLAWQARHPDAEPITAVGAWLTVAARRALVDQARRAGREHRALARLLARTPAAPDPGEAVTDQALAAWLTQALHRLPPTTQQVCQALGSGATVTDAALRLGLTPKAVRSHLTRARRLLRILAAGAAAALAAGAVKLLRPATAAAATPLAAGLITATITLLPQHTPPPQPPLPPAARPAPDHATIRPAGPTATTPRTGAATRTSAPAPPIPPTTATTEIAAQAHTTAELSTTTSPQPGGDPSPSHLQATTPILDSRMATDPVPAAPTPQPPPAASDNTGTQPQPNTKETLNPRPVLAPSNRDSRPDSTQVTTDIPTPAPA